MKDKKKTVIVSVTVVVLLLILGITYALTAKVLTGTKKYILLSNDLQLYLDESQNLNDIIEENLLLPMEDFEGKQMEGYHFKLVNDGQNAVDYAIYLDEDVTNTMPISALRYNLTEKETKLDMTANVIDSGDERKIHTSTIRGKTTHEYTLRIFLGVQAGNDAKNKSYSVKIRIEAEQTTNNYYQPILNGCDPVLSDNLVPVVIEDDGTVKRANLKEEWYNYSNQRWANAVVLENKTNYSDGQVISEENIQSYFVWIPRFKYKLFDMGSYSSLASSVSNKVDVIDVVFESKEVTPSVGTKVGDYHSHPAFQAFDTNGFWVGKFESGYKGATTTAAAQQNNSNSSNLIVKPNVYSWRNITVGNAFKASYDYMRSEESHMMKNTEWGAVAYLQHSIYGSRASIKVNNNNSHLTGYAAVVEPTLGYNNGTSVEGNLVGTATSVTQGYNTPTGYTASTTGNISGVYDMSGGAWEYVMGYNTKASTVGGSSGLTSIYGNFFSSTEWDKYYDKYSSTSDISYNNRILGDATGEMGPFANVVDPDKGTRHRSSWYGDYAYFVNASLPWFNRGAAWHGGVAAGSFAFSYNTGDVGADISFRVVLTP